MGAMLNESLEEYLKIEIIFYSVCVVFPLGRVNDDVVFEKIKRKTIINKNIFDGNGKVLSSFCTTEYRLYTT